MGAARMSATPQGAAETQTLLVSLVPVDQDASGGFVPVKPAEFALGIPAVRLELTLR